MVLKRSEVQALLEAGADMRVIQALPDHGQYAHFRASPAGLHSADPVSPNLLG